MRARAALLTVVLSGVALGACSSDAESPERADLKPVAEDRAPGTPVLDAKPAAPREEERKRKRAKPRKRREAGIQKAAAPSAGGGGGVQPAPSAPSRPAPVADAPAPPAAQPAPPAAQPTKPPAGSGGGDNTRAKPTEVECAPRCP